MHIYQYQTRRPNKTINDKVETNLPEMNKTNTKELRNGRKG